jgi:hypothetical protein
LLNIISLGAGVQSSTMALMAAHGEITPMPDCAIFADTQAEPEAVYEWLDWLEKQLPFPVYRVTAGSLVAQIMGDGPIWGRPPFFTESGGMVRRQCTGDFKIAPIRRKIRELTRKPLTLWIGISLDEAVRMKESDVKYITHQWPLVEKRLRRSDCIRWLESKQIPIPGKSACTFCPYHNDAMWRDLKLNDKSSFAEAVAIDKRIRNLPKQIEPWYVHRSLKPLDQVDFSTDEDRGQLNMFNNECEGMCGV